jgi:hypothetical protein
MIEPAPTRETQPAPCTSSAQPKRANDFVFSFPTATNRLYVVEWTTELTSGVWTSLPDVIEGDGTVLQVTHVGGAALPQRFYRIRLIY